MVPQLLAVVFLVVLLPAFRVALKPPVWEEARTRPLLAAAAVALGVTVVFLSALALLRTPRFLPFVVTLALVLSAAAWLRARPSWGRARGLPPGSLGLASSMDAITVQNFYAQCAARWGPVFKMAQFHRPVACITDLPMGLEVLEAERSNLAQPRLAFGRLSPGNYIEFMNDERHTRYRGILRTALNGRVIKGCRNGVGRVVRAQLRNIESADEGAGVDPNPFLDRIAFVTMLRVMCGVAVDDDQLDDLQSLFKDLGAPRAFAERRPEQRIEPFGRLVDWVRAAGQELSSQLASGESPEPSVLSEILGADPAHLHDETILGNLILIVHVTHSNIRGLLGWILKEAVDHPRYVQQLREVHDASDDGLNMRALATNFVSETLRLHQSEYFYREVVRDVKIGGYRVPAGWLLRVCVREAHDNPDVFPEPHVFRPERFADRNYDKTEYCPFSDGAHSCFGAGLAVMIANVFFAELALHFDSRVTSDGPVERHGNRHWGHWQPSEQFRVSIKGRDTVIGAPAAN